MRTCDSCGLVIEVTRLITTEFVIHMPENAKEVLRALHCPMFGAQTIPEIPANLPSTQKADDDILDTPSYWRSKEHFWNMWKRS